MAAEKPLFTGTFPVGERTVTLTVSRGRKGGPGAMVVEWTADRPARLTPAELAEYRAGRDAALAELGHLLGGRVAVVEVGDGS